MKKRILLYYKYVNLPDPDAVCLWQKELCNNLNLKGRIILGSEGINGTLVGSWEETKRYMQAMSLHPLLNDIDFKEDLVDEVYDYFPKLRIVVRSEIVSLGVEDPSITPTVGGVHLTPDEVHAWLDKHEEDIVVFDVRNRAESRIGTFQDALTADIEHFRDLPSYIDENLEKFRDKNVLMTCTGGIRCEKATAYLKAKGVSKGVYQMLGGIHRYIGKYPQGFFKGKNYVFDNRVAVKVSDDILGTCDLCGISCDDYTNCLNAHCNKHFISCNKCLKTFANACSQACKELLESGKVPYRPTPDTLIQHKRS